MTDGNTYAINKHLNDQEGWDELQEVTTELEQAEARIEELEGKLARAVDVLLEAVEPSEVEKGEADNIMLIGRIEELEAKLAAKEKLKLALAGDKIDLVSELAGVKGKLAKAVEALGGMVGLFSGYSLLLKGMHLNMELDNARTTLAELNRHSRNERTRR